MRPFVSVTNISNCGSTQSKFFGKQFFWGRAALKKSGKVFSDLRHSVITTAIVGWCRNNSSAVGGPICALLKAIPPFEIAKAVVVPVSIQVTGFLVFFRLAYEANQNQSVDIFTSCPTKGHRQVAVPSNNWGQFSVASFWIKNFARIGDQIFGAWYLNKVYGGVHGL